MKALYDTDCDSRQDSCPSHFPWDNPHFPFGNGTDKEKKCGAPYPYPVIPLLFPRRESSPPSPDRFVEELLNIPDITVENTETDGEGNLIITVRSTVTGTRCNRCGRKTDKPYGHGRRSCSGICLFSGERLISVFLRRDISVHAAKGTLPRHRKHRGISRGVRIRQHMRNIYCSRWSAAPWKM